MKARGATLGLAAAALASAVSSSARAEPQWNVGLESGVCGTGSSLGFDKVGWCNAGHADLLLLRQGGSDFGLGPSLRLGTARFSDARLDAGLSVLIPLFESFPLVLEAGPHLRDFSQPGVFCGAFFGLRSFNYYGHYEMAAGLSVIAERSFTAGTPSAIWITTRIDGAWLALPAIFFYNALK